MLWIIQVIDTFIHEVIKFSNLLIHWCCVGPIGHFAWICPLLEPFWVPVSHRRHATTAKQAQRMSSPPAIQACASAYPIKNRIPIRAQSGSSEAEDNVHWCLKRGALVPGTWPVGQNSKSITKTKWRRNWLSNLLLFSSTIPYWLTTTDFVTIWLYQTSESLFFLRLQVHGSWFTVVPHASWPRKGGTIGQKNLGDFLFFPNILLYFWGFLEFIFSLNG